MVEQQAKLSIRQMISKRKEEYNVLKTNSSARDHVGWRNHHAGSTTEKIFLSKQLQV